MEDLVLAVLAACVGAAGGGLAVRRFFPAKVEVPVVATHASLTGSDVPHEHEYDHVRGGGKMAGRWRCGICNEPQPKKEAAS